MRLRPLPLLLLAPLLVLGSWMAVDAGNYQTHRMPAGPTLVPPTTTTSRLKLRRNHVVRAVQRVKDAVVNIHSERTVHGPSTDLFKLSPSQNRINGMGTGIIIDERGYIVTNHHVVEDVSVIRVRLSDGTTTTASIVGRNKEVDLALLKISAKSPLPTMPLGTAKDLMVGEDVIAIGNAFGYEHTVSKGIVSAVKRDVNLNKEISYRSLIQTDASINPGNSGGPLLNINGELIGINVAIRAGAQGIGFAIPVDTMIAVVSQMLRNRRLRTASEGMVVRDDLQFSEDGTQRRVLVDALETKGQAAKAGLQRGDEILKIAGVPVLCSFDVDRALLGRRAGERLPFIIQRDGKTLHMNVVLAASSGPRLEMKQLVWQKLGLRLAPVEMSLVRRANQQLNGGMQVISVKTDSVADRAGIHRGDILVGLHQWETKTYDNIAFVLQHADLASFNPMLFYIIRNGQVRRGWLQQVE